MGSGGKAAPQICQPGLVRRSLQHRFRKSNGAASTRPTLISYGDDLSGGIVCGFEGGPRPCAKWKSGRFRKTNYADECMMRCLFFILALLGWPPLNRLVPPS